MDGMTVYFSVFISFISLAIGQTNTDIGLNTCRMQLSCGDEIRANSVGTGSVGIPGKRGPIGPTGLKGAKGGPCDCGGKLSEIESRLNALETPKCSQTKFIFANEKQTSDWIKVKEPIQEFTDATVCSWLSSNGGSAQATGAWLSYNTMGQDNEFLFHLVNGRFEILLKGGAQNTPMTVIAKTHLCVVISRTESSAKVFRNGLLHASLSYVNRDAVAGGGSMLIGQEQDAFFGRFDSTQAFSGTVENFKMWYRVLNDSDITTLYNNRCYCPVGYSIALTPDQIQFGGKVKTLPTEQC